MMFSYISTSIKFWGEFDIVFELSKKVEFGSVFLPLNKGEFIYYGNR